MRHLIALITAVALLVAVSSAFADPPESHASAATGDDDEHPDPRRAAEVDTSSSPEHIPFWLSVGASAGTGIRGTEVAGLLALGATLDALARPTVLRAQRAKTKQDDEDEGHGEAPAPRRPPPALTGPLARGTTRAALATMRSLERHDDLDDLATRARASGLLPELRVRLAHVLDEDQKLSPTEYDPERVTASGGTSLWIEGRATFHLDRLVFADDEVAIERLRADRERTERGLVGDVLQTLEKWQRGTAEAADETLPEQTRLRAELDAAAAEAVLDVLTDGWFTGPAAQRLRAR